MARPGVARSIATPVVAIDVRILQHAGIGTYIRNLVPRVIAARPDWRFTLLADPNVPPGWPRSSNVSVVSCSSRIYTAREQVEIPLKLPRGTDLYWSPHYNIPLATQTPLVATVHDVCHLALPEMYGGILRQRYARSMFNAVRRRATEIIFVSDFSRAEFARHVGGPNRSTTIHNGVGDAWASPVAGGRPHPRPYLLTVGSAKPHKNLVALLRAFEMLVAEHPHDLLIVGGLTRNRTVDTVALRVAAALGDRVRILENVDDETLRRLVANAAALVFPSLYEGFGLPALEAMAAGCPCVVSSAASLPEVCGDGALYFDPRDPSDVARQVRHVLDRADVRGALIAAGRRRAAEFSWDVAAGKTLSVLERALSSR